MNLSPESRIEWIGIWCWIWNLFPLRTSGLIFRMLMNLNVMIECIVCCLSRRAISKVIRLYISYVLNYNLDFSINQMCSIGNSGDVDLFHLFFVELIRSKTGNCEVSATASLIVADRTNTYKSLAINIFHTHIALRCDTERILQSFQRQITKYQFNFHWRF